MSRFVSLAGQQVAELAERAADSGRVSRGRALFRKGSVSDLTVTQGSLIASVRGSEGDGYETTVGTALAPPGVLRQIARARSGAGHRNVDDLVGDGVQVVPKDIDLAFSCDCPDWDDACKHAVAVLLAFADRVDLDETELLRWRAIDLSASPDDEPASADEADPTPADEPAPADRSTKLSELQALLGDTVVRVPAADGPGAGAKPQPDVAALDPALAEFLGIDRTIDPIDVSQIPAPAPLFTEMQLGPLADLAPELAEAIALIMARLDDPSPR